MFPEPGIDTQNKEKSADFLLQFELVAANTRGVWGWASVPRGGETDGEKTQSIVKSGCVPRSLASLRLSHGPLCYQSPLPFCFASSLLRSLRPVCYLASPAFVLPRMPQGWTVHDTKSLDQTLSKGLF